MKIWPVILDSQPSYLGGHQGSILLLPLGAESVIQHLCTALGTLTDHAPLVVSTHSTGAAYERAILDACPSATVVTTADTMADAIAAHELSDALLIIDPRNLPLRSSDFSSLLAHYTREPRVAHHLVVFESAVAGTKERVSFDSSGNVRRILRHYEAATWPYLSSVIATLLPAASGILADGVVPASLAELRRRLVGQGVPSRDVPLESGTLDLSDEAGVLTANELFVRRAVGRAKTGDSPVQLRKVGDGQVVHETVRISGPVVLHQDVRIGEDAMVFGPAVIGAGARIGAGAVVAHAVVGPGCTVPDGAVVRDRSWFEGSDSALRPSLQPRTRKADLALVMADAEPDDQPAAAEPRTRHGAHARAKRTLDFTVAALLLLALSPILVVVALAVWLQAKCRGSILYGDEREGMDGHVFHCWKFRTMYQGAHAAQRNLKTLDKMDGPHFKLDYDPRVTRVGRVLRALNLDELPQLFNVLLGQMSLVGPRPSPFRENQLCVPWREARLSVRPGITGFWQVCRHDRSAGDFHQWIEYDLLYVQHMSFWLDLKILAATFLTLGGKVGYAPSSWLVTSASVEPSMRPTASRESATAATGRQIVPTA